jgi:hypothetical protein
VLSYTVKSSTGAAASITAKDFWKYSFVKIAGLENGKPVTFTVSATNAVGESVASLASAPVTPTAKLTRLGPPQRATAIANNGKVSIHFQAPKMTAAEEQTNPLLAYAVTVNPGNRKVTFTGRRITSLSGTHTTFDVIDGLVSGVSYTFTVAAVGPAGEGVPVTTEAVIIP